MSADKRVSPSAPLLAVDALSLRLGAGHQLLNGVSFSVGPGETLCIVGESGSGKTLTALSLMSLLPAGVAVCGGDIRYQGRSLLALDPVEREDLYGNEIAMIFQDPMSSLNPVLTIGQQICESIARHQPNLNRRQRRARAEQVLGLVGIPNGEQQMKRYPHQLSGGMNQRVVIATALVNHPRLIVADEPTTALDVTVQAKVMATMRDACRQTGAALLLITHDMGLVAQHADRLAVMYAGRVVEQGRVEEVFRSPRHPYTRALLASIPRLESDVDQDLAAIEGEPPLFSQLPPGCAFHPRCGLCGGRDLCRSAVPPLRQVGEDTYHLSACHFTDELTGESEYRYEESSHAAFYS